MCALVWVAELCSLGDRHAGRQITDRLRGPGLPCLHRSKVGSTELMALPLSRAYLISRRVAEPT